MIQLSPDRWVRPADLMKVVHGREDGPDLLDACVDFLEARQERPDSSLAKRAKAQLASAQILQRVSKPVPQDAELLRRLTLAEKTIDRLLAFVPARAPLIASGRLTALTGALSSRTNHLFPELRQLSVTVTSEEEIDTEACHRLTMTLALPESAPVEELASRTMELHRAFAELTSPEERRAIRFIVDPITLQ